MQLISKSRLTLLTVPFLIALCDFTVAGATMDPRFEIDPQSLSGSTHSVKFPVKRSVRSGKTHSAKITADKQGDIYIVKPGDHLFKILMRGYGLSNDEADSLIEKIKSENNIKNIKQLRIGQKIIIPLIHRRDDVSFKSFQALKAESDNSGHIEAPVRQSLILESPVSPVSGQDVMNKMRGFWDKVVPAKAEQHKSLELQTPAFSLTLDPQRYPVFSTMDGARILLDKNGSIPPLVKALIEEKDPSVRIVSESPDGGKHFVSSMLKAAGFYSVEENFRMDFGADPKLTVNADFKIEKTAESLIKQEVVLMNSGSTAVPPSLNAFLKKEGFLLYEPFASLDNNAASDSRRLHLVTAKKQPEIVDAILSAFSISPDHDRSLDVFAADNNGISLSVKAERYFERNGQRFVVTQFDGDPINYTLFRILETKGYRVVILEEKDDFRKVSEKIVSRMKMQGSFDKHNLLKDNSRSYSLQMSGYRVNDPSLPGGALFLTDIAMDQVVSDLLTENGYSINGR